MRTTHLLAAPVDRAEFEAALPEGWVLSYDEPATAGRRVWNWRRAEGAVALIREVLHETSSVVLVDAPELEAALAARLGFVTSDAALAALRGAQSPLDRVRALRGLAAFSVEEEHPEALALVAERLLDPHPAVRWAALHAVGRTSWPGQVEAVRKSAERHPDMAGPAEALRRWAAKEAARRAEEARAREAAAREARLEALLAEDPAGVLTALGDEPPKLAWRWRSRAWAALDRPTSAWIALYTSIGLSMGRYDDDDPEDADEADELELPEGGLGEPTGGVIEVLAEAFDVLLAAAKNQTLRAVLDGLKRRLRSPLLRFAQVLRATADFESPPDAAKLAAEYRGEPDAHWLHAQAASERGDRGRALEACADAWLGALPAGRKKFSDEERAWLRARVAAHRSRSGALHALEDAASTWVEGGDWEQALRVSTRALSLSPRSPTLLRHRAVALSMLRRHDEAVAACGEALDAADAAWGPEPHGKVDPRWLLHFNRAAEHALAGRREVALDDLRRAVARNPEAGPKALADDYFQALWPDPAFAAAAHGIEAVDRDDLVRGLRFVVQNFFHGDRDEAVAVGRRALAQARVFGDPRLLAEALRVAGNTATYTESPARGVALLQEAVEVSERAFPDEPGERAEAWHLLGAARHAAQDWDAAEAAYLRAEALRREAGGDDAPALAISYADRARLASDRGAPLDEVLALGRRAGELCARVAATDDEAVAREALDHATVIWSNAASAAAEAGQAQEAYTLVRRAVEAFEGLLARNGVAQERVVATTVAVVKWIFTAELPDTGAELVALRMRLLAVEEPHPAAREELLWWAEIRGAAQIECAQRPAAEVAAGFGQALRGDPPAWFLASPSLGPFVAALPRHLPESGSLVLVAMAMSMATDAASLDGALDQLQGIAVAHRRAQGE